MSLNVTQAIRQRINRTVSHHVEMRVSDSQAATNQRLDDIEQDLELLLTTLATLQQLMTGQVATLADRLNDLELLSVQTASRRRNT
jgi:hypothetical protein